MKLQRCLAVVALALSTSAAMTQEQPAPSPTPQQRVAMLKQWLAASQAQLRNYEWVETTVVAKDGEEKSRTDNRCYYGVDGVLQKVAVATSSTESAGGPPGILIPGKIIKRVGQRKKDKLEEYMESAAALVHSYVPPDQNRIQQSANAGKYSMNMIEPGRRVQLVFRDYLKEGDSLSADIELPTNRLMGLHVASYVEEPKDVVALDVVMSVLPDGTIYAARSALDAKSKGVTVVVTNGGHR